MEDGKSSGQPDVRLEEAKETPTAEKTAGTAKEAGECSSEGSADYHQF